MIYSIRTLYFYKISAFQAAFRGGEKLTEEAKVYPAPQPNRGSVKAEATGRERKGGPPAIPLLFILPRRRLVFPGELKTPRATAPHPPPHSIAQNPSVRASAAAIRPRRRIPRPARSPEVQLLPPIPSSFPRLPLLFSSGDRRCVFRAFLGECLGVRVFASATNFGWLRVLFPVGVPARARACVCVCGCVGLFRVL